MVIFCQKEVTQTMTPDIKKFIEELDMRSFTHAWLKFNSAGSVFIGEISEYRFIGNRLTLNLTNCTEVREFTIGEFGEKQWRKMRTIGEYSFEDVLDMTGTENACMLVSASSDENTSVFTLQNGDEIMLTKDEKIVKDTQNILKE